METKATKAESPPPSTCEPITHRRGWRKVREEAGEKVGVLRVLLEEGDKHGGQDLCGVHDNVTLVTSKSTTLNSPSLPTLLEGRARRRHPGDRKTHNHTLFLLWRHREVTFSTGRLSS